VRLVEVRLLEGPNVYRLEPVAKVEVAVGRRRTWYGQREPGAHALVRLGASVPARHWPDPVASIVAWVRRLRATYDGGLAGVRVHRSSDPGHWIVTWPWTGAERARTIAEAAYALAEREVSPARRAQLTGAQARLLARHEAGIAAAGTTPPAWIRDAERRMPIISISGTNGKSTVTRLITHILVRAGRRVGMTTSDGVLVNERMVDPGDWTGPGGAAQIIGRHDVDVAVLETARGGIVLRGVGYESNDASVLTNVSSDHLDLQGIHTLPELAEVKATICRITRPDGWVVLNGDDPHVAAIARRVRAHVAYFSLSPDGSTAVRRHLANGGRAYVLRRGALVEVNGARGAGRVLADVRDVPIAIGGLARHNVANALAAAGGARALGATIDQVGEGLRDFRPSTDRSPGRLNIFRLGSRVVIVDFAHNEAGVDAILDVAEGIAGGAAGRAAPITMIIGTAGDRPDDTLRGIGRIAARRAQRIAIKETLHYLRGRSRDSVVGELMAGVRSARVGRRQEQATARAATPRGRRSAQADGSDGASAGPVAGSNRALDVPVYPSETAALRAELNGAGAAAEGNKRDAPRVIVLMCHEEREEVFGLLRELGARPVDVAAELTALIPRLQDRPRA
jgi:cyanophycin synthetase